MTQVGQDLLVRYITALNENPLRTKMYTSGFLAALAEILAGKFAGVAPATKKTKPGQVSEKAAIEQQPVRYIQSLIESLGINQRAFMMYIYGFAVSAPLGHFLTGEYNMLRRLVIAHAEVESYRPTTKGLCRKDDT